jgi:hypothetical protein
LDASQVHSASGGFAYIRLQMILGGHDVTFIKAISHRNSDITILIETVWVAHNLFTLLEEIFYYENLWVELANLFICFEVARNILGNCPIGNDLDNQ